MDYMILLTEARKNLTQRQAECTLEKALDRSSPSVSTLKKYDPRGTYEFIRAVVAHFAVSLNVSKNLEREQVEEIAANLIEHCPHYSLDDFLLFFKMIKTGRFGQLYGSIDIVSVFSFLAQYEDIRAQELDKLAQKEKDQHKENLNGAAKTLFGGDGLEKIKELLKDKPKPPEPTPQHKGLKQRIAEYARENPFKVVEFIAFDVLGYTGGHTPSPDRYGLPLDLVNRIQKYFLPMQGSLKTPAYYVEALGRKDQKGPGYVYHPEVIEFANEIKNLNL